MSTEDKNLNHAEPEIDPLTNDRYLGGHEYDGIRELDNKMPRWWLILFLYGQNLRLLFLFHSGRHSLSIRSFHAWQ